MAAPDHRLLVGITVAHQTLAARPDEARQVLDRVKSPAVPTDVVVCGPRPPDRLSNEARRRSLWAKLRQGAIPDWLEPLTGGSAFAVYRLRP